MRIFVINRRIAALVCAAVLIIAICAPFLLQSSRETAVKGKELPIYCVDKEQKEISITFDSAWGNEDLDEIIEVLNQYECKATFFVVGSFIDKYPDDVKKLYENGHEIANHSNSHAHYNALSREAMIKDMDECDAKIKNITAKDNKIFRAPYGEYNSLLVRTCMDTGRYCIQWDVEAFDIVLIV